MSGVVDSHFFQLQKCWGFPLQSSGRGYFNVAVLHKCAVPKDICAVPSPKMCSPECRKTGLGRVLAEALQEMGRHFFICTPPRIVSSIVQDK